MVTASQLSQPTPWACEMLTLQMASEEGGPSPPVLLLWGLCAALPARRPPLSPLETARTLWAPQLGAGSQVRAPHDTTRTWNRREVSGLQGSGWQ